MVSNFTGCKKVEMKKKTNKANLEVTFSKRRFGLFKKASELATLCGAEVAVIVFSPSGKAYSFVHPNMDVHIDRFTGQIRDHVRESEHDNVDINPTSLDPNVARLFETLTQELAKLEVEEKKNHMYKMMENQRNINPKAWYEKPPSELDSTDVLKMQQDLHDLKKKINDISNMGSNNDPNIIHADPRTPENKDGPKPEPEV